MGGTTIVGNPPRGPPDHWSFIHELPQAKSNQQIHRNCLHLAHNLDGSPFSIYPKKTWGAAVTTAMPMFHPWTVGPKSWEMMLPWTDLSRSKDPNPQDIEWISRMTTFADRKCSHLMISTDIQHRLSCCQNRTSITFPTELSQRLSTWLENTFEGLVSELVNVPAAQPLSSQKKSTSKGC